jgi:hypothetical protein
MWTLSCGGRHAGSELWRAVYGRCVVEGGMWAVSCGGRHVGCELWREACGQ